MFWSGWLRRRSAGEADTLSLSAWKRETEADARIEAGVALGAARALKGELRPHLGALDADKLGQVARLISSIWKLWQRFPDRERCLLWVDDNPDNNVHEMQAFAALGIETVTALNTEEALLKSAMQAFSVVITDTERNGDALAAFSLLDGLRRNGNAIPVVVYSPTLDSDRRADARRRGALDFTDDPQELLRLTTQAMLISLSEVAETETVSDR